MVNGNDSTSSTIVNNDVASTTEIKSSFLNSDIICTDNVIRETIVPRIVTTRIVVVSEAWPSWVQGLLAVGFRSPQVFSPDPSVYKPFFSCRIRQLPTASQFVSQLHLRFDLLLLSGTAKFFASCNPVSIRINAIYIMEGNQCNRRFLQQFPSFTWRRIRHSAVGGVTNASYWYGWNWDCVELRSSFSHHRALIHMLGPAAKSFQKEVEVPL